MSTNEVKEIKTFVKKSWEILYPSKNAKAKHLKERISRLFQLPTLILGKMSTVYYLYFIKESITKEEEETLSGMLLELYEEVAAQLSILKEVKKKEEEI